MLKILTTALDDLRAHAEREYPGECCGVLLGMAHDAGWRVVLALPTPNQSPTAQPRQFRIAPRDLVRLQAQAHRQGLAIAGFYHSHPDAPADWSPHDLDDAFWTGCSYLIVAVDRGRAAQQRSFLLIDDPTGVKAFAEEAITLDDAPALAHEDAPRR